MTIKQLIFPLFTLAWIAAALPIGAYDAHSILITTIAFTCASLSLLTACPTITIPKTPLIILGGAFWALAGISVTFSEAPVISYIFFIIFTLFPLAVITIYTLLKQNIITLRTLLISAAAISAILIINAFIQRIFFEQHLRFGLVQWPLANPNTMAGLLSLFFFMMLGGILAAKDKAHKITFLILALGLFSSLTMTGSRGAFLALLGSFAIFSTCLWPQIKSNDKYIITLIIICATAFAAFELIDPANTIGKNLVNQGAQHADHLWHRAEIWRAGWQMFLDRPVIGSGIGTFHLYYPEYRSGDTTSGGFAAHNDPLQFAIEMGATAPILFYAFLAAGLTLTIRAFGVLAEPHRIALLTIFCALGAFIVHTHMTFHFMFASLLITTGGLVGAWLFLLDKASPFETWQTHTATRPIIAFIGIALTLIFLSLQLGNILTESAGTAKRAGDLTRHATLINAADKITKGHSPNALIYASQLSLSALETNPNMSAEQRQAAYSRALNLLARAQTLNPRAPSIYATRAKLYTAFGYPDKAAPQWAKFRKLIWNHKSSK
ncbi:MAG: O-antigen ligase family protein [Alphaproteobacteria bacterium]